MQENIKLVKWRTVYSHQANDALKPQLSKRHYYTDGVDYYIINNVEKCVIHTMQAVTHSPITLSWGDSLSSP